MEWVLLVLLYAFSSVYAFVAYPPSGRFPEGWLDASLVFLLSPILFGGGLLGLLWGPLEEI